MSSSKHNRPQFQSIHRDEHPLRTHTGLCRHTHTAIAAVALSRCGNHEGGQLIFTIDAEKEILFPGRLPQSIHKQNPFTSSLALRDASTCKGI